jgi:hypothetical protein
VLADSDFRNLRCIGCRASPYRAQKKTAVTANSVQHKPVCGWINRWTNRKEEEEKTGCKMEVQACITVSSVLVFSLCLSPAHTELISASLMHQLQFGMSNLLISNAVLYILSIC